MRERKWCKIKQNGFAAFRFSHSPIARTNFVHSLQLNVILVLTIAAIYMLIVSASTSQTIEVKMCLTHFIPVVKCKIDTKTTHDCWLRLTHHNPSSEYSE